MTFSFLSLLSLTGDVVSVGDVARRLLKNPERDEVVQFVRLLEPKKVLYAEIDQEDKGQVIGSIEEIKRKTEEVRSRIGDSKIRRCMARLIGVMSTELGNLWAYDTLHRSGQAKMFLSLQRFRVEMAKTLAILCHSYGIDPASTELQKFIVNFATVRPRSSGE